MLQTLGHIVSAKPGLGAAPRAGMLAAVSAPKQPRTAHGLRRLTTPHRPVLAASRSATTMALVTGPQMAISRLADRAAGGPPVTPHQIARHRQVTLAGNAALILAGMLAQRAVVYKLPRNATSTAALSLGRQLAAGGVAGAMVVATDVALGEKGRQQLDNRKSLAFTAGGAITALQSLAVRQANKLIALPPPPNTAVMPVLGLGGVRAVTVPVAGRKLVS